MQCLYAVYASVRVPRGLERIQLSAGANQYYTLIKFLLFMKKNE